MDELVPPVVTTKPARGREMQTTTIPIDMFDTMRMISAKKTLGGEEESSGLQKPTDGTAEYYHEGYVDGKMYLVPDSNLEAMKDIINFKMRPRRSTRYKHQTSYEISDYDHLKGKLDGLFTKLDTIQELQSNISDEDQKYLKETSADDITDKISERRSEEDSKDNYENEYSEYKSEHEDSDIKLEYDSSENKSEVEGSKEKPKIMNSKEELNGNPHGKSNDQSDVHYLRFLVSGHFKRDQKPIYIIQEYNGEPNLFKNQKADFFSNQKDGDVDVFISGKFYSENMLEESDGIPVALLTKPDKIKIETEKCKIYFDYFKDIYIMKNHEISLKGEFIKNNSTNRITPFLTLSVEKKTRNGKLLKNPNHESKDKTTYRKSMSPTTILVNEPKYNANPFSQEVEYISNGDVEVSCAKEGLNSNRINKTFMEADPSVNENSSQQVATRFFSLSFMGEDYLGEGTVGEPINKTFDHPSEPSFNQNDILSIDKSTEDVPVSGESLNAQSTPQTKKTFKEGFLKTLFKGSTILKTLLEKIPSRGSFEINGNTQNMNVENTEKINNIQQNPANENHLLENQNKNTPKNIVKSIFCKFK